MPGASEVFSESYAMPDDGAVRSLSVVIAAHNVAVTLGAQLEALCGQEYEGRWDVVVVDNRSTDATAEVARAFCDRMSLRVVPAFGGRSVAYARNVGIAASRGDLLVFVDGDDVAAPGLLAAYARAAERFEVMGGHLDDAELNDPVTASWRYRLTSSGLPIALGRFAFCMGANFAVRRRVLDRIGMFDETLRFVGEDVDLSIRAQLAGFQIGWVPEAVVHYRYRESLKSLARQQYVYGRGSVVLYDRYRDLAVPAPRAMTSARRMVMLVCSAPNLVRGRTRRGQWLRLASFVGGQVVESVHQRVWYVG